MRARVKAKTLSTALIMPRALGLFSKSISVKVMSSSVSTLDMSCMRTVASEQSQLILEVHPCCWLQVQNVQDRNLYMRGGQLSTLRWWRAQISSVHKTWDADAYPQVLTHAQGCVGDRVGATR